MTWKGLGGYILRKLDNRQIHLVNNVDVNGDHTTQKKVTNAHPKVSIAIPTRDKVHLLKRCIESIKQFTEDSNIELIIIDNNSHEGKTALYLEQLKNQGVKILSYPDKFNYSAICNLAADNASGEYLCFLNNDTEVVGENWLSSMVEHASNKSVGIVGAILTFPDDTLQHMGVALGYTGVAGHPGRGQNPKGLVPENCYQVSAVTFACAVISAKKFKYLGGLNPDFPIAFNDVDICIRASNSKLKIVVCTNAHLRHGESQTRNRTLSLAGFLQGVKDVLMLLRIHNRLLGEDYFFSRVLPDKLRK
jgi:GT2 family glycosyltransferase